MASTDLAAQIRAALSEEVSHEAGCPKDYDANDACRCGRGLASAALLAVLDLHVHKLFNRYGKATLDVSQAVDGRCQICGNVFGDYVWCHTVRSIARELHVTEAGS